MSVRHEYTLDQMEVHMHTLGVNEYTDYQNLVSLSSISGLQTSPTVSEKTILLM